MALVFTCLNVFGLLRLNYHKACSKSLDSRRIANEARKEWMLHQETEGRLFTIALQKGAYSSLLNDWCDVLEEMLFARSFDQFNRFFTDRCRCDAHLMEVR